MLLHLIAVWLVSALAVWLVAKIMPGFEVSGFGAAMVAAAVIAVVNAVIGPILRFIAFPITFLTFGLFSLVINALLLKFAAMFTSGFRVRGFLAAFLGSIVLAIVTGILRFVVFA
jgi:putative membrane protein